MYPIYRTTYIEPYLTVIFEIFFALCRHVQSHIQKNIHKNLYIYIWFHHFLLFPSGGFSERIERKRKPIVFIIVDYTRSHLPEMDNTKTRIHKYLYIYTYVCVLTLRIVLEKLPWVAYTHPSVFFHFLFCHARNTPIAMGDEMVFCIRYDVHVVGDGRNEARYRRSRQLQMVFYWFSPCAWRKNKTWWGFDRRISAFALRVHTYKYFT